MKRKRRVSAGMKGRKAAIDRSPLLSNAARIFGQFGPVPVTQDLGGGKFEIVDARDGSIIARTSAPRGPRGVILEVFKSYPVRLLKPIRTDNGRLKIGTKVFVQMMPGGTLYAVELAGGCQCIKTGMKEGVDFEWIV